jgi:hypothetical protein
MRRATKLLVNYGHAQLPHTLRVIGGGLQM